MTIAHGAISLSGSLAGTTGVETDDWATGCARQVLDGGLSWHVDAPVTAMRAVSDACWWGGTPMRQASPIATAAAARPVSGLKAYRRDALVGPGEGRHDR
jgi:hypothetical protein